jgi:hypothetical protein
MFEKLICAVGAACLFGCGDDGAADDGAVDFSVTIENISGDSATPTPIAPGIWVVHQDAEPLFSEGKPDRGQGLESLSEDGDPNALLASLSSDFEAGLFSFSADGYEEGAATPGDSLVFSVTASAGDRLSFAAMFVQSNDFFVGLADSGIALFDDAGVPLSGELEAFIWNAGTEIDQPLGEGADQAPRQASANTGADEGGNVEKASVDAADVARVTVTSVSP